MSMIGNIENPYNHYMKTTRLILTFYKNFIATSLILSCCCAYALHINGMHAFALLFWFKVLTLGLTFYFIGQYKKKEFYYYQNLGISKLVLWVSSLSIDMLIFIALMAFAFILA